MCVSDVCRRGFSVRESRGTGVTDSSPLSTDLSSFPSVSVYTPSGPRPSVLTWVVFTGPDGLDRVGAFSRNPSRTSLP